MISVPEFDVVGVGLNATDTMLIVPHFPAYAGKVPFQEEILCPGGQVASAMVACARLGLRTKYIGAIGDDERGRIQMESLHGHRHQSRPRAAARATAPTSPPTSSSTAPPASAPSSGGATIACASTPRRSRRSRSPAPACSTSTATTLRPWRTPPRSRAATASRSPWTSTPSITASTRCCRMSTTWSPAPNFPTAWTGESDPFSALETIQNEYGMRVAAMTLGAHGSLARENGQFYYSPAFVVNCVDTTGAGDVFHGAFCYAVLQGMPMRDALEFSNAMAALNCTALGARGGIRGLDDVRALMARAERRSHPEFAARAAALT